MSATASSRGETLSLDVEVAVRVFGRVLPTEDEVRAEAASVWEKQPDCMYFHKGFAAWTDADGFHWEPTVELYSVDIAAAWSVVEKMASRGLRLRLEGPAISGEEYVASFESSCSTLYVARHAPTAPLAICRAALAMEEIIAESAA